MICLGKDKDKCSGCAACCNICSQQAISMKFDSEGFLYPHIDEKKCIACHLCESVCSESDNLECRDNIVEAYAAYTKDSDVLNNSSSGGVFSEIAKFVINRKGIVYGAGFSDDFTVKHIAVETIEELRLLRGSKYVQSEMGNCYAHVKQMLDSGRLVLFTGTPCQVVGLKKYLHRDYDHLLTQDIICHGVPSPLVWKKYIEQLEENGGGRIADINFRDKKYGWKNFSLRIGLSNGGEYRKRYNKDLFMRGFLDNIYLRPSCYNCNHKNLQRISDFTLADFWGIQHVCPEMENPDGTSLVWLNTDKSKKFWKEIKDGLIYKTVDLEQAIKYNSAAVTSVAIPENRTLFFDLMRNSEINEAIKVVLPKDNLDRRIAQKVKNVIRKMMGVVWTRTE